MFFRIVSDSFARKPRRKALTAAALALGMAVATATLEGEAAYQVEAVAKPEAAVVWGRILYWVRKADFVPLKEEFYDERGTLVRTMRFSDVRSVGGRRVPTRWEMRPESKPGNATHIVLKTAVYDQPIPADVFSQRNLQKP